jgi:hypothetical protein
MNRIVLVSALALTLAGCNATVRPSVDMYVPAPRHHIDMYGAVPYPTPRPYYEPHTPRSMLVVPHQHRRPHYEPYARPVLMLPPRRPRCATVWQNTPRGYVERRVCGNHIP